MSETICASCKFRLIVPSGMFHCAADVNGWAYLWSSDSDSLNSLKGDCQHYVRCEGKYITRELDSSHFWDTSGDLISPADWVEWKKRRVSPTKWREK